LQEKEVIDVHPSEFTRNIPSGTLHIADYFDELRDTWANLVAHVESCLESFMQSPPANYRLKPLPEQPHIEWAERVLPNFRDQMIDRAPAT
jgi:hypothetical protein